MESEYYEGFVTQFNQSKIAYEFKNLIISNESLKEDLFNEFIKTEKVPSLKLFTRQFISDEEWADSRLNDMFSEDPDVRRKAVDTERRMWEAIDEFNKLKQKGAIDKSFYDFNIEATNSVKILLGLKEKLETFERIVINNQSYSGHEKDAEVYAASIFFLLSKFSDTMWLERLSEVILEDNTNGYTYKSTLYSPKELNQYLVLKEHFNFHLRSLLLNVSKKKSSSSKATSDRSKQKPQDIKDIWLGSESEFWRIVKTYANDYTEEVNGRITWRTKNGGITYLAGFTYECQQKGWIRKNAFSAPTFKIVYQNTFNITFDPKPFKQSNLEGIHDQYCKPFKGIKYRAEKLDSPQNPRSPYFLK